MLERGSLIFLRHKINRKSNPQINNVALQNCIKANPGAFSKDILEDEEVAKDEKPPQQ